MGGVGPPLPNWPHRIVCAVAACLLILFELSVAALPVLARVPNRDAETIAETRLRVDPSLRSHPLVRLPAGATLTIRGTAEDGWFRARHGRLEGYVRSGDVATTPLPPGDEAQAGEAIDEPVVAEKTQRARDPQRGNDGKDERKQERKSKRKQDRKKQRKHDRKHHGATAQRARGDVRTSTDLNLRAGPAQDTPVSVVVPRGERVEPTGQQRDGWVELRWEGYSPHPEGTRSRGARGGVAGWALGRFLAAPRPVVFVSDGDATTWSREELKSIIYAAADRYGQSREDMLRVARCESDLIPSAINHHGGSYGLFQFKPGTWRGTPFAEYDIFDPRANANAAAWMWSVGRRREWVCQ